ncbi:MAG: hypothetical protein F4W90_07190 [Gammaproteobacteria bacterium]|nr:hypothetical protein [Gammaproteobacteria bacterium]
MREQALWQLQKLGIDLWVSEQHAQHLIQAGKAHSLAGTAEIPSSRTQTTDVPRRRIREFPKVRQTNTTTDSTASSQPKTNQVPPRPAPREVPKEPTFKVALRVFVFGRAAVAIETGNHCPDQLLKDVVLTLNGFDADHVFNEFHFSYPVTSSARRSPMGATLAGAQQGFLAWLRSATDRCETLLAIGDRAASATKMLENEGGRLLVIDNVPYTPEAKKALWDQIKTSND